MLLLPQSLASAETDKMLLRVYPGSALPDPTSLSVVTSVMAQPPLLATTTDAGAKRYGFAKRKNRHRRCHPALGFVSENTRRSAAGPVIAPPLSGVTYHCHHYDTDRLRAGFISIR